MRKSGVVSDRHRRRKHVSKLQDRKAWKERRELPPANETWPTCLIIAPSTVVHNWKREFETVRSREYDFFLAGADKDCSGDILKLVCIMGAARSVSLSLMTSRWGDWTLVRLPSR